MYNCANDLLLKNQ